MTETQKQIERIIYMEQLYDQIQSAIETGCDRKELRRKLKCEIQELTAYYEGEEWLSDFDADREGKIPGVLKKGVLSEDGIWNLLCEIEG